MMRKLLQYGSMVIGFIFGAGALIFGFLSYFIRSAGADNTIFDGLGRQLEIAPTLVRFLYLNDTMWPGLFWAIFDWLLFFGLFGLAYLMFKLATRLEKNTKAE